MICNYNNNDNLKSLLVPTCATTFMATEPHSDINFTDLSVMIIIMIFSLLLKYAISIYQSAKSLKRQPELKGELLETVQQVKQHQQALLDNNNNNNQKLTVAVTAQIFLANDIDPKDFEQETFDTTIKEDEEQQQFDYQEQQFDFQENGHEDAIDNIPQLSRIEPIQSEEAKLVSKQIDQHPIQGHQEWFLRPNLNDEDLNLMSYSEKARRFYYLTTHQKFGAANERQSFSPGPGNPVLAPCLDMNLKPTGNNQVIKLYNEPHGNDQTIDTYNRDYIIQKADNRINQVIELFTDSVIESYKQKKKVINVEPEPPESLKLPRIVRLYQHPINLLTDLINQSVNIANLQIRLVHLNHQLTSSHLNRITAEESILKLKSEHHEPLKPKIIPRQFKLTSLTCPDCRMRKNNQDYPFPDEIGLGQSVSSRNYHDNLIISSRAKISLNMEQLRNILYIISQ